MTRLGGRAVVGETELRIARRGSKATSDDFPVCSVTDEQACPRRARFPYQKSLLSRRTWVGSRDGNKAIRFGVFSTKDCLVARPASMADVVHSARLGRPREVRRGTKPAVNDLPEDLVRACPIRPRCAQRGLGP